MRFTFLRLPRTFRAGTTYNLAQPFFHPPSINHPSLTTYRYSNSRPLSTPFPSLSCLSFPTYCSHSFSCLESHYNRVFVITEKKRKENFNRLPCLLLLLHPLFKLPPHQHHQPRRRLRQLPHRSRHRHHDYRVSSHQQARLLAHQHQLPQHRHQHHQLAPVV